jgi:DNA-binding beta-propeller fold protein YncE
MQVRRCIALACFLIAASASLTRAAERHLLYMTTPDAAQGGGSGEGLLIFDIDKGHEFIRRIDVPSFKEGVRGVDACAATGRLYVTTSAHRLVCMDLKTDNVLWEKTYDTGCDRGAITPDGKVLYIPSGWWIHDQCWLVVSGETGEEIAPRIKVNGAAHNTLVSLDGTRAYLASTTALTVVDTKDHKILQTISPIGETGVFPFTINGAKTRAYVCLGNTIGVDVADLTTGKVLGRILTEGQPIHRRTHGAGLTPDEKELWISDQAGNTVYVFDNTVWPLKQLDKIGVKKGGHGWVAFSVDGRYAYTASTEVIDVKSRKIAAIFKDEKGKPVCSSKFVEVQIDDGKVVRAGDQFGVGRLIQGANK